MTTPAIPQAAADAALRELGRRYRDLYQRSLSTDDARPDVRALLEAAAPHIREDEREHLAATIPHGIIDVTGEVTAEQLAELKAKMARSVGHVAWPADGHPAVP